MKLLILFIFLIVGLGMLLLSILKKVGQMMYGKQGYNNENRSNNKRSSYNKTHSTTNKIFSKNEGEYINFEEIKE